MRIKIKEISINRVGNALIRRIKALPHKMAWSFHNKEAVKKFENLYEGKRCFLVANGPSLKKMDLTFLKNEVSFGLNRIYLGYESMNFTNNYLVSINGLVLSQFNEEIAQLQMPKFLNWESRKHYPPSDSVFYIYKSLFGNNFGIDASVSLNPAATVTYAALQIIYYMGFKEVYIIGLDHNFETKQKNKPNKMEVRDEEIDHNHFHPNYFPKGSKWETPDLVSSEYFYKIARDTFEKDRRKIYDCTIDGKCTIFEKKELSSVIN